MKIIIPSAMRNLTDNKAVIEISLPTVNGVETHTVSFALSLLRYEYRSLIDKIFKDGKLNKFVLIYVNCEDIRFLEQLETKITDKDELMFDLAISGG